MKLSINKVPTIICDMSRRIELIGNTESDGYWSARALCPSSGESTKNIFCPLRNECTLPEILVRANGQSEAFRFADQAQRLGQLEKCLDKRPYKVKSSFAYATFQPTVKP